MLNQIATAAVVSFCCLVGLSNQRVTAQQFAVIPSAEEQVIQAATAVLTETMSSPGSRIPQAMLSDAHGVAIIPNVIKGSFIVGARHGRGLLFIRDGDGAWHAPVFITLTGANVGWQIGVNSSDLILVFRTQRSIQGVLSGSLTIGADAAAAAGPVGRQAAVATDGRLQAEIFTYSRSRGLFAGVSLDGSVLRIDQLATGAFYQSAGPGQPLAVPPSAHHLTQLVAAYTAPVSTVAAAASEVLPATQFPAPAPLSAAPSSPAIVQQYRASNADVLRNQLTQLAPQLYKLLDDQWETFLAMPSSLFLTGPHPNTSEVATTLQRFDRVATDPTFSALAARPEFQSVHGILKYYQQALNPTSSTLQLPPPPPLSASFNQ